MYVYVTANRLKKFGLRSSAQHHRHLVGFFNFFISPPNTFSSNLLYSIFSKNGCQKMTTCTWSSLRIFQWQNWTHYCVNSIDASLRRFDGSRDQKTYVTRKRRRSDLVLRLMLSPSHSKHWSLLANVELHKSNTMFDSVLRKIKKDGLDKKHIALPCQSDRGSQRSSELLLME